MSHRAQEKSISKLEAPRSRRGEYSDSLTEQGNMIVRKAAINASC
jgi:hypothetical protein